MMESTSEKKSNGKVAMLFYIGISALIIAILTILLVTQNQNCNGRDNFSYCPSLSEYPCNTTPTNALVSCNCPGTYNGMRCLPTLDLTLESPACERNCRNREYVNPVSSNSLGCGLANVYAEYADDANKCGNSEEVIQDNCPCQIWTNSKYTPKGLRGGIV